MQVNQPIGKQLAKALDRRFYDSDKEIEKRSGVSISWIFEVEGEDGFRSREQKALRELTKKANIVLATGGGAILSEDNRRLLLARGHTVYLSSSVEQLYQRTAKNKNRPLLNTGDRKAQIQRLLAEREPLYRDIADIELRTDKQSIGHVVYHLISQLKELTPSKQL